MYQRVSTIVQHNHHQESNISWLGSAFRSRTLLCSSGESIGRAVVPATEEFVGQEEPAWLAGLLAQIDLIIIGMRAEDAVQERHWRGLRRDLPLLVRASQTAGGAAPELAECATSILSGVLAAVEEAILLYHLRLAHR